jgi:hypothetical protein
LSVAVFAENIGRVGELRNLDLSSALAMYTLGRAELAGPTTPWAGNLNEAHLAAPLMST